MLWHKTLAVNNLVMYVVAEFIPQRLQNHFEGVALVMHARADF